MTLALMTLILMTLIPQNSNPNISDICELISTTSFLQNLPEWVNLLNVPFFLCLHHKI